MPNKLITIDDVGKRLGVCHTTVYRLAANGFLPRIKVGSATRFREEDVAAFIEQQTQDSSSEVTTI